MTAFPRYFQVRIRAADNLSDVLVLSSHPSGTNPYLAGAPTGDGLAVDVLRARIAYGSYTVLVVDADTGGGTRVVTDLMANAGGRYDLLGRVAVIDTSPDGSVWTPHISGYLEAIRYPTAVSVELAIGDSLRIDRRRDVFKTVTTAFGAASALIGGPVIGGFGEERAFNYGPWRMKVGSASGTTVRLDFVSGMVPTTNTIPYGDAYVGRSGTLDATAIALLEDRAAPYRLQREEGYWFPGLVATLDPVTAGSIVQTYPIVGQGGGSPPSFVPAGRLYVEWSGTLPAVNDEYDVTVQPSTISSSNPLHVAGHPIDILTALWDEAGIAYDATSAADVKAIIGPTAFLSLRITQSYKLADFQESVLMGPYRFAFRSNTSGERELFSLRRENTVPSSTIDIDDLLGNVDAQPVIFSIDEGTFVRSVSVSNKVYNGWNQSSSEQRPPDTIIETTDTAVVELEGATDGEDVSFDIPGAIGSAISIFGGRVVFPSGANVFVESLALSILPRFGFGCPSVELLVHETVTDQVGEEVLLDLPHQVNGAVRGGQRVMQIVKRTERLADGGVLLTLLDAGEATVASPVPTFTVAASGTEPKRFASVTITNAAALIAAGNLVTIEYGTGGSAPSTGATLAIVDPNDITVVSTPRVDSGSHLWFRMRSDNETQRPSAWSSWDDVDLADLTAPSSLGHTGNVLNWTTGEGPQEVLWRPAAESVDRSLGLLPDGANTFNLTEFVPLSTSIVATVRSRDEPPYAGVSSDATLTFTTAGGLSLTAPSSVIAQEIEGDDYVSWTDGGPNPTGTTYEIERSTVSSSAGFSEVAEETDLVSSTIATNHISPTWYRVRARKAGYTTTSYSSAVLRT